MLFTNHRLGDFAKDPAVVRFHDMYYMYYSIKYAGEPFHLGLGIATSADMEVWQDVGDIPATQPCEMNGTGAPAAIVLNGVVHLFYQTYGNRERDAICHAVSTDGVHFDKDPGNPVFCPTADWCCGRAIDADVTVFGGRLMLYFATRDHAYRTQKLGCASADLNSAFTRGDFRQEVSQSILSPEMAWEGECIEAPAAITHHGRVYLFYGGGYNCYPQQIGCAMSDDGVHFHRLFNEPFMKNGAPGTWNACESGHPYAFRDQDGRNYLFYQGTSDMGKTWYLSKVEFVFNEKMPVLVNGEMGMGNGEL